MNIGEENNWNVIGNYFYVNISFKCVLKNANYKKCSFEILKKLGQICKLGLVLIYITLQFGF